MPKADSWFQPEGKGLRNKGRSLSVRFPQDIDEVLRTLPNTQDFVRSAVREKMEREGLLDVEGDRPSGTLM